MARVLGVLSGGAGGQIAVIAATPVITRLYSPAEFGHFALLFGVGSVMSVAATGRYELAVVPAQHHYEAALLTRASLLLALGVAGLCVLGGIGCWELAGYPGRGRALAVDATYIALLLTGSASFRIFGYAAMRAESFRSIAWARAWQGIGGAGGQILLGWLDRGAQGLVVGLACGYALSSAILLADQRVRARLRVRRRVKSSRVRLGLALRILGRHKKFPMFSGPSAMVNALSAEAPVFLVRAFFGAGDAGLIGLVQRVMGLPLRLVSQATSQVFFPEISKRWPSASRRKRLVVSTLLFGAGMGALLALTAVAIRPAGFGAILGSKWRAVGELAELMAPLVIVRAAAAPVSTVFYVTGRQRVEMLWQIGLLIGIVGAWALAVAGLSFEAAYLTYIVVSAAIYLIELQMILGVSQIRWRDVKAFKEWSRIE